MPGSPQGTVKKQPLPTAPSVPRRDKDAEPKDHTKPQRAGSRPAALQGLRIPPQALEGLLQIYKEALSQTTDREDAIEVIKARLKKKLTSKLEALRKAYQAGELTEDEFNSLRLAAVEAAVGSQPDKEPRLPGLIKAYVRLEGALTRQPDDSQRRKSSPLAEGDPADSSRRPTPQKGETSSPAAPQPHKKAGSRQTPDEGKQRKATSSELPELDYDKIIQPVLRQADFLLYPGFPPEYHEEALAEFQVSLHQMARELHKQAAYDEDGKPVSREEYTRRLWSLLKTAYDNYRKRPEFIVSETLAKRHAQNPEGPPIELSEREKKMLHRRFGVLGIEKELLGTPDLPESPLKLLKLLVILNAPKVADEIERKIQDLKGMEDKAIGAISLQPHTTVSPTPSHQPQQAPHPQRQGPTTPPSPQKPETPPAGQQSPPPGNTALLPDMPEQPTSPEEQKLIVKLVALKLAVKLTPPSLVQSYNHYHDELKEGLGRQMLPLARLIVKSYIRQGYDISTITDESPTEWLKAAANYLDTSAPDELRPQIRRFLSFIARAPKELAKRKLLQPHEVWRLWAASLNIVNDLLNDPSKFDAFQHFQRDMQSLLKELTTEIQTSTHPTSGWRRLLQLFPGQLNTKEAKAVIMRGKVRQSMINQLCRLSYIGIHEDLRTVLWKIYQHVRTPSQRWQTVKSLYTLRHPFLLYQSLTGHPLPKGAEIIKATPHALITTGVEKKWSAFLQQNKIPKDLDNLTPKQKVDIANKVASFFSQVLIPLITAQK